MGARRWSPASWAQDARWLALAGPGAIFVAHLLYGAMLPQTALALAFLAALLLGACLLTPQLRREFGRMRHLRLPAALFGAVILVGLWSMTPFVPGGPHPVWAYVGISPGAATLDKSNTLLEIIKLLGLACIFAVGAATGASDARARLGVHVTLALGAAFGLWSFLAFAGDSLGHGGGGRLGATFLSANTAATLFAMLLMLSVGAGVSAARSVAPRERLSRVAPYAGAGLIFVACLLGSASRGGSTAAAAALLAFAGLQVFLGRVTWSRAMLTGLVALILAAAVLAAAGDLLVARFLESSWETDGRTAVFQAHWEAFRGAPWMGYGLGGFDTVNRLILNAENAREIWAVRAAHNVYLSWLEQAGLIGALPMFGCIGAVILLTVRATARRTRMTAILFALLAADVVVLVHGLTDFGLETYSLAAFWSFLLGLQFSLAQGTSRR